MYTETNLTITFENTTVAEIAKNTAREAILSLKGTDFFFRNAVENSAANLAVNNNSLVFTNNRADFTGDEMLEVAPTVVKAIAAKHPESSFTFDVCTVDDYTEAWVEGNYANGALEIKSTYYPEGYCEEIDCPECGEYVVRLDEYDPSKTYICPDCGEEVDLSERYETCKPVVKKEVITIK